jgi:purine-binding chemotaxis protein CheW
MNNTQQAIFCIGEEEYGLDIMQVNIIEKYMAMRQAANSPKNVKGVIDLRGDIIPIYSLRRKFGLSDAEPDEETRFIITSSNGLLMAYEVDKMQEIVQLNPEQINAVPPIIESKNTSYVKAVTNLEGRLVLLLDNDAILTQEEQNGIKAMLTKNKK